MSGSCSVARNNAPPPNCRHMSHRSPEEKPATDQEQEDKPPIDRRKVSHG